MMAATGRTADIAGLGLEALGVALGKDGKVITWEAVSDCVYHGLSYSNDFVRGDMKAQIEFMQIALR